MIFDERHASSMRVSMRKRLARDKVKNAVKKLSTKLLTATFAS